MKFLRALMDKPRPLFEEGGKLRQLPGRTLDFQADALAGIGHRSRNRGFDSAAVEKGAKPHSLDSAGDDPSLAHHHGWVVSALVTIRIWAFSWFAKVR